MKLKRIHKVFVIMYILSFVLLVPAYFQTRYTPEVGVVVCYITISSAHET